MKENDDKSTVAQQFLAASVQSTEKIRTTGNQDDSDFVVNKDAVTKIAGVTAAIAAIFLSGPVGAPLVVLMAITALFMPDVFVDDSFDEVSRKLTELIFEEVDKAQMNAAIALANAALVGKFKLCDNIADDFNTWKNTKDEEEKSRKTERLRHHYITLTTSYEADMITHFLREDFRGILVPQYVMTGMRYLVIIATYYHYADELELPFRSHYASIKDAVLAQLRKDIASFTDTAIASYRHGLQKILNPAPGRTRAWDDYNDYRNKVTRTGVDLLPQFHYLDPILYPYGCDQNFLSRRLLTFFDTFHNKSEGRNYRKKNIAELDERYYLLEPVMSMRALRLSSAHAFALLSEKVIDGPYASQCLLQSIDGHQFQRLAAVTGDLTPETGTKPRQDFDIGINCYEINGYYWNSSKPVLSPNGQLPLRTITGTIASMQFLFEEPGNRLRYVSKQFTNSPIAGEAFSTFQQNTPSNADGVATLPSHFSDRLVEFDTFMYGHHHGYLLSWRPKGVLEDLLPRKNHVATLGVNRTVQFHAIKAARDVSNSDMEIVKGPDFCGGDLVNLRGGNSFSFYLERNPARWFAGFYFVRLWFVNLGTLGQLADVEVNVEPEGNFIPSKVSLSIAGMATLPELSNLKYADLRSITFNGSVLITAAFPAFTLRCSNNSLGTNILIDRIELIFDHAASFT